MISLTKYAGFSHPLQGCGKASLNKIPPGYSFPADPTSSFSSSSSRKKAPVWLDKLIDQPWPPERSRLVDRWWQISELSHTELTQLTLNGGVA